MVWWVREDCCGVFCGFMTIFLLCFALFVQLTFVVGPGLGYLHPLTLFYVYITVMAAISHMRTQFTNPGAVPLNNDQVIESMHEQTMSTMTSSSNDNNNNNKSKTPGDINARGENKNNININNNNPSNSNNINSNNNTTHATDGNPNDKNSNINTSGMSVVTHKQTDPISRRQKINRYFSEMQIQGRWCNKCSQYKPSDSHHCSTCGRCIIKMDHHCPWVNNCVAMMNQKYFVLFLFYTALCCGFCLVSLITRFISCNHHNTRDRDGDFSGRGGSRSSRRRPSFGRRHSGPSGGGGSGGRASLKMGAGLAGPQPGRGVGGQLRNLLGLDDVGNAIVQDGVMAAAVADGAGDIAGNGNDNINQVIDGNDVIVNNGDGLEMDDLSAVYGDWCDGGGLDVMFCMLNMFEGILFGLFTCIMSCDQISSIMNNVTYIDSIQMKRDSRKKHRNSSDSQKKLTGMDNLAFIFGETLGIRWFLPVAQTDKIKKDFRQLCSKFD